MREKINTIRHLGVLFITIIIFFLGVFIGGSVEELRVEALYTQLQDQDLDYQNLLTESRYIDYLVTLREEGDNVSCELIEGAFDTSIANLDDSRIKLEGYINTGSVKEDEFYRLKGHYGNTQINYWILANRINSICDTNRNTILYFYEDKKECPACDDQGVHLNYVKQRLGQNVLIFSLDAQREGSIQLLASQYEVPSRETPVLVIDEEVYGFSENAELFRILCNNGIEDEVCLEVN